MAPWHLWYAWHPVRTRHHGWMWFRTVWRQQRWSPESIPGGQFRYWEYYAVTEEYE